MYKINLYTVISHGHWSKSTKKLWKKMRIGSIRREKKNEKKEIPRNINELISCSNLSYGLQKMISLL